MNIGKPLKKGKSFSWLLFDTAIYKLIVFAVSTDGFLNIIPHFTTIFINTRPTCLKFAKQFFSMIARKQELLQDVVIKFAGDSGDGM